MKCSRLLVLGLLFATQLLAQTLTVNGSTTHADIYLGSFPTFQLTGPAGAPFYWIFSDSPGPFIAGPVSIPVGPGTGFVDLGGGQPFVATGQVGFNFEVPTSFTSLVGVTLYSAAIFVDPNAPGGLVPSNGISFTFRIGTASAGPDAATLVNKPVGLDGSGNRDQQGNLPAGITFDWQVVSGPAGAAPALTSSTSEFASFKPDLPGTYVVRLNVGGGVPYGTDTVVIDAYDINFTSPVDGSFGNGTTNVSGTVTGPTPQSARLNGSAIAIQGNGAFNGGTLAPQGPGPGMSAITLELTAPSGQKVAKTVSVLIGTGQAITSPASPASALRVNGITFDPLEGPIAQVFGTIDFNSVIAAIPAIPLLTVPGPFGITLLSVTADPTGFTYDPTVLVDFFPGANGAVGLSITFTNVVITSNMTGVIFNAPYNETATITATSAVITGNIAFVQGANGMQAQVQGATTTLNGFAFTVTGALGNVSQIGTIQQLFRTAIQTALAATLQLLPPLINPLIAQFNNFAFDLSAQGIPLSMAFAAHSLFYDAAGLTVGLNVALTPTATNPDAPALTQYRTTPGVLPTFGATTPVQNNAYTIGVGLNDDTLNVFFASLTATGGLNLDVNGQLGTGGTAIPLTAGSLATALPQAGFEKFAAATPVVLHVRHTTAPSFTLAQSAQSQGTFYLSNVKMSFDAIVDGNEVPVFAMGFSASTSIQFVVDPQTGALTIQPGTITATATSDVNFPGFDGTSATATLGPVVTAVITSLFQPFSSIPLPGAQGGVIQEIGIANDWLITYF